MTVTGVAEPPTREELALAIAGGMDEAASKALAHAAAMRGQAEVLREQSEKLLSDAAVLERRANELLAGAELLGIEAGESDADTAEVADHGTTVNGRGEKVDFAVCVRVAQRLGRFTRERFQEELALKPTVASRWIARLREHGALTTESNSEGDVIYDFVTPEAGGAPPKREPHAEVVYAENGRGQPVPGTRKVSQQAKRDGSRAGHRHPGRRN